MPESNSRTLLVEKDILHTLLSTDPIEVAGAVGRLPTALSVVEVSDVGLQVNLLPGTEAIEEGRRLENRALLNLAACAIFEKSDLVTARNCAKVLRSNSDFIGYALITWELRKARKQIVGSIINS